MLHRNRVYAPKPVQPWKGPKPSLRMRTTPICRVLAKDLEAYLEKVYRTRDCDVREITGAKGAMTPEFIITGVLGDISNLGQQILDIRSGYRIRNLRLALNLLCKDGFIPKGIYVIDTAVGETPIEAYRKALNKFHDPLNVECIRIKEENRKDRDFMRQAVLLDKRVLTLKEEEDEPTPA